MDFSEIISSIYPVPQSSADKLRRLSRIVSLPKGYHVLEEGKLEPDVFFLAKGIACAYIYADARKITFWIGSEGSTIVALRSYVSNQSGYETVELMEDSDLYQLNRNDLYKLFDEDINVANWGRKFAELEFLRTEQRLISSLFSKAADRYKSLIANNPELLQRIPLESLATYLGITPVSLSRIRANLK
jgi:CRP-like cAMP-binding protein